MLPQSFIEKVKESINLIDLVREYTNLEKCGDKVWAGFCPNPKHEDGTPSFRVFEKGYKNGNKINEYDTWACMGCHYGSKSKTIKQDNVEKNYGSDCFAFYQWMHNVSWREAVNSLCKKYGIALPNSRFGFLYKQKKMQTSSYIKNINSIALEYLYSRGLTDKEIEEWKIGFDGKKIVFPLMDRYENVIAFTKRWLVVPEGRNDKYKNSSTSSIFNKSNFFYGLHRVDNGFNEIRLTEGTLDVILAYKYNVKNVVATLGTAFTDAHAEYIKKMGLVPVFIMDGDGPGIIAAEKAINKLADMNVYSKILILPHGKDLCEISLEYGDSTEQYIEDNSFTYGQYKINNIINSFDSSVNELKIKKFTEIKDVLEQIPYEPEKNIMKEYVLEKMKIKL